MRREQRVVGRRPEERDTTWERKGRAEEVCAYNGLVVAWPELAKLGAQAHARGRAPRQEGLFDA